MFEEDLSLFFQEFGCKATSNGKSMIGILNHHPHQTESFNLMGTTFITPEAETIDINLDDKILIASQVYEVIEKIPNGLGLIQLKLSR